MDSSYRAAAGAAGQGLVTCARQACLEPAESARGLLTWAVTACGFGVWHRVSVARFSLASYTHQEDFAAQSPLVALCPSVGTRAGWTPRPPEWSLSSCTSSGSRDPVATRGAGLGGGPLPSSGWTVGAGGVFSSCLPGPEGLGSREPWELPVSSDDRAALPGCGLGYLPGFGWRVSLGSPSVSSTNAPARLTERLREGPFSLPGPPCLTASNLAAFSPCCPRRSERK